MLLTSFGYFLFRDYFQNLILSFRNYSLFYDRGLVTPGGNYSPKRRMSTTKSRVWFTERMWFNFLLWVTFYHKSPNLKSAISSRLLKTDNKIATPLHPQLNLWYFGHLNTFFEFQKLVIERFLFLGRDYQNYKRLKGLKLEILLSETLWFLIFLNSDFRLFLKGIIGT